MNRAERRAAMRLSQSSAEKPPISEAQLAANKANAQLSTGPKTAAGRAVSSLNAVKTALTGRTVLLPSDDVAEYQNFVLAYQQQFNPVGGLESDLVQAVADTTWRLRRITTLEHALFAKGRLDAADNDDLKDADPALIDLHTMQTNEKQLRNLHLQEARLARRREKDIAELRQLQNERQQKQLQALAQAASLYLAAKKAGVAWTPAPDQHGFVLTIEEIERYLASQSHAPTKERLVAA